MGSSPRLLHLHSGSLPRAVTLLPSLLLWVVLPVFLRAERSPAKEMKLKDWRWHRGTWHPKKKQGARRFTPFFALGFVCEAPGFQGDFPALPANFPGREFPLMRSIVPSCLIHLKSVSWKTLLPNPVDSSSACWAPSIVHQGSRCTGERDKISMEAGLEENI